MKRRKHAKTITYDEFLSKRKDVFDCDIEDVLCKDYVYLLDSMDMEDFEYYDTSFDIFKEIVYKNKVVGFVSYMDEGENGLKLMEAYVMQEYRNNNLLYDEISSVDKLSISQSKISFVKDLIESGIAEELDGGIVVSEIPFNVSSYELKKDFNMGNYYSHVYDLNNGSVLILENAEEVNYSKSNWKDKKKYDLKDSIDDDYLTKAREIVCGYDENYLKVLTVKHKSRFVFVY